MKLLLIVPAVIVCGGGLTMVGLLLISLARDEWEEWCDEKKAPRPPGR